MVAVSPSLLVAIATPFADSGSLQRRPAGVTQTILSQHYDFGQLSTVISPTAAEAAI
jgi:hypothetical protein